MSISIAEKVIGDAIPAEGRLQVYADRFRASLLEVLANTFPVTRGLVGEAFFAQTPRAFLIFDPPRSPLLWQYGNGFPTFLAALPDLGGHQYLPDIAAFEWALNLAEHAEDVELLQPGERFGGLVGPPEGAGVDGVDPLVGEVPGQVLGLGVPLR